MTDFPDLRGAKRIGIDIETYDPDIKELGAGVRRNGYMVGMSVAIREGDSYKGWYLPIRHGTGGNVDYEAFKRWAKDQLTDPNQDKVFTNCLYDLDYITEHVDIQGRFIDILNSEPLIDENQRRYGLDVQAKKYLGYGKDEKELEDYIRKVHGRDADVKGLIWTVPARIVEKYAIADAIDPLMIFDKQEEILKEQGLIEIFDIETRLVPLLLRMKKNGVRVDTERAVLLEKQYQLQIKEEIKRLNQLAGYEVNYNAARSIARYLDEKGIEYTKTAKSGAPSITKEWLHRQLNKEDDHHEFFDLVLKLRQDYRLSNAFINGIIMKYAVNGRVHCQFNQLKSDEYGTVSGRFSSSLPNLQQVPSPDKNPVMGPLMRSLFLPEEGHEWSCFDYSQIEPRVTLHYSTGPEADEAKRVLWESPGMDTYANMVESMLAYDLNINHDVLNDRKLFRKMVKTVFLGLTYSMGTSATCKRLGVPVNEGMEIIETFNKLVPYVKRIDLLAKSAAENRGYVKTILGRRARFNLFEPRGSYGNDRFSALPYAEAIRRYGSNIQRAFCYRALNRIIQGGSADIMKLAMVKLWESGVCDVAIPHLTVHDEMDFSLPIGNDEIKEEVVNIMENVMGDRLTVPLKVDAEFGDSWGSVK